LEDADYEVTARALLGQDCAPAGATCRNKRSTGAALGQLCGDALCPKGHHSYRCAIGGGLKRRSIGCERVWERIHAECGFQTEREVHVPGWDRWRSHCTSPTCTHRGLAYAPPAGLCPECGTRLETKREEAILDLEVRSATVPRLYLDITVHHSVPGDGPRLARAADRDGAVNAEAESEKAGRYPAGRTPWRVVALAQETCGRFGLAALKYLRKLARKQAANLEEHGELAASALVLKWGCWLSVALHRESAKSLRKSLGEDVLLKRSELAAEIAD